MSWTYFALNMSKPTSDQALQVVLKKDSRCNNGEPFDLYVARNTFNFINPSNRLPSQLEALGTEQVLVHQISSSDTSSDVWFVGLSNPSKDSCTFTIDVQLSGDASDAVLHVSLMSGLYDDSS